jgi:methyl-accepting chemotaxis protein
MHSPVNRHTSDIFLQSQVNAERMKKQVYYISIAHLVVGIILGLLSLFARFVMNKDNSTILAMSLTGLYSIIFYSLSTWLALSNRVKAARNVLIISVTLQFDARCFLNEFNGSSQVLLIWVIVLSGVLFNWKAANFAGLGCNLIVLINLFTLKVWNLYTPPVTFQEGWGLIELGICFSIAMFLCTAGITLLSRNMQNALEVSETERKQLLEFNRKLAEQRLNSEIISDQLVGISGNLVSVAAQQNAGASEQASAVSQITVSLEELSQTAEHISHNANSVTLSAEDTLKLAFEGEKTTLKAVSQALQGQEASRNSISGIFKVQATYEKMAENLTDLTEYSNNIDQIVRIISEISTKTHLLALNASIESANAGEFGERFGVVAREVKSLADNTRRSAKEINDTIIKIREGINNTTSSAREGLQETINAVKLASEADTTIQQLIQVVEKSANDTRNIASTAIYNRQLVEEIQLATRQQQSASHQILTTMRNIGVIASQTSDSTQQVSRSVDKINTLANKLTATLVTGETKDLSVSGSAIGTS